MRWIVGRIKYWNCVRIWKLCNWAQNVLTLIWLLAYSRKIIFSLNFSSLELEFFQDESNSTFYWPTKKPNCLVIFNLKKLELKHCSLVKNELLSWVPFSLFACFANPMHLFSGGRKASWLAEMMLITWIMQHVRNDKLQLSGLLFIISPTVRSRKKYWSRKCECWMAPPRHGSILIFIEKLFFNKFSP